MIALACILLLLCVLAIGAAWAWEAHRVAKINHKVFEPKPATPSSHDAEALRAALERLSTQPLAGVTTPTRSRAVLRRVK